MLVDLLRVLQPAQHHRYAVGSFNTANLELTQAIIAAAEESRSPVIVSTTEKALAYGDIEVLASMVRILGRRARVPVVLNLDHGHQTRTVQAAIRSGYTGVMFDASRHPFAVNVRQTRNAVVRCRAARISVEGEIGSVGGRTDLAQRDRHLTDPVQAVEFVRRTRVAALAVSIGNVHGGQFALERLDFPRLKTIAASVRVPLVLHGASGTPSSSIRHAIALGIAKINIDTDLRVAFTRTLRSYLPARPNEHDPRPVLAASREAVRRVVRAKMKLFASEGKA